MKIRSKNLNLNKKVIKGDLTSTMKGKSGKSQA